MKLDVESLRALQQVVESGTFTEAAAQLGMTQSAVSWKIKRLEERVGLELVKRGSEIEATPDGRDLLAYAERIIQAHDEAVDHLSRSDLEGVVRLGTNEDLRGGQLADVLARFGRMYPHIKLHVRVHLSGRVEEWLDDGEVDLAVMQIPVGQVDPDDIVLWREPLHWVHGVDHRFEADEEVPVVTFGPGLIYLDASEAALDQGSNRWRTVLECPMLSGVQAAVEAGLGLAALNPRNHTDQMVVWEHSDHYPMEDLCEVIRSGPVSALAGPDVLATLRQALSVALDETEKGVSR